MAMLRFLFTVKAQLAEKLPRKIIFLSKIQLGILLAKKVLK